MPNVQVNIQELVPAFHNGSTNARFYVDRKTGQILLDFDGMMFDDTGEDIRRLLQTEPGRFVLIDSIGSRETRKMMQEFIAREHYPKLDQELREALASERPFQNFRNAIGNDPKAAKVWYEFEKNWVENLARRWLNEHGIEAELFVPPEVVEESTN